MALTTIVLALAQSAASASTPVACSTYMGQTPVTSTFEQARERLPRVEARSQYESTAEYERRLSAAAGAGPVIIRGGERPDGLRYDADRQEVLIRVESLGQGQIDFNEVLGLPNRTWHDNFTQARGFRLGAREVGRSERAMTNGFGAQVSVTNVLSEVDAIWEATQRVGTGPFVGLSRFEVIARLPMGAAAARDLIEGGSLAYLMVPRPPYQQSGITTVQATFNSPTSSGDFVRVIVGDIQCGFLLDSRGTVVFAATVK